jgi:uncharacterized protein YjbI with pentapeptide repeats
MEGSFPFGWTSARLADYRGAPVAILKRLCGLRISRWDFSSSDFRNVWLEDCHFDTCRFDRTSFMSASDHGNQFRECSFDGADFTLAHFGVTKTSRYEACSFVATKLNKTGFLNPVFEHCQLAFDNAKSVDFGCSGFWDCSFAGRLEDIVFRGRYRHQIQRERNSPPVMTGLHNVDFSDAHLKWISPRDACSIDGIKLPSGDMTFLYRRSDFLRTAGEMLKSISEPERQALSVLCKIVSLHATEQDIGFLCQGDLMALCDEDAAQDLFLSLKRRYQLGHPYALS